MTPLATTEPRLAVDMSGGLIRVVDGALGGPLRCGTGGTPTGSLVDGKIVDPAAVASALRHLLARTEIDETRALIAASDAVATFRVIRLAPGATDHDVDAAVTRELPMDPERMATQWVPLRDGAQGRLVYAVAWDRSLVRQVAEVARLAGLDPFAVDLKSACMARTVATPACVVVDMTASPAEIVLVDGWVPQVWRSFRFETPTGDDFGEALADPLATVLRFYKRRRDTDFEPTAPIFIAGEQVLASRAAAFLSRQLDHRVTPLPVPGRIPPEIRHNTYLTCLGLLARREGLGDTRSGGPERRRPLVEINLLAGSRGRPSWPPRPRLSSAKKVSGALTRFLGRR